MKNFKEIKAVIFDLDDTLLDRSKTFDLYCEHLINKYFPKNIKHSRNTILQIKEFDKNGYEPRNIFYKNIVKEFNLKFTVEELENEWFNQFDKFSIPENNLINTLEYLFKKYKLAIITNGSDSMQNRKIEALKIKEYFLKIIISENIGIKKPDKNIFLLTCNTLNILPNEAVYIGDNYDIDIIGAINAGLKAIWIKKFNPKIEYEFSVNELHKIIEIL